MSIETVTVTAAPSCVSAVASVADRAESELLEGLMRGSDKAWREFHLRYDRLIYRCITKVTGRFSAIVSQDDIREIYATLIVQLLSNDMHKLRTFDAARGNRFSSWLGLLAINAAYDYLRGIRREPNRAPARRGGGPALRPADSARAVRAPAARRACRLRAQALLGQGQAVRGALLRRGHGARADRRGHEHQRQDGVLQEAQDPEPPRVAALERGLILPRAVVIKGHAASMALVVFCRGDRGSRL
jgi:DNA-directed RNA polymerase specialized sigma24 family protein